MGIFGRKKDRLLDDHLTWRRHQQDLTTAAGIGVATLLCHRETWAYFVEKFERGSSSLLGKGAFRPPAEEEITDEGDGMITVPLSGSTLAALLGKCRDLQGLTLSEADRAIGLRVEMAISRALEGVGPSGGDRSAAPAIVLDDRTAPAAGAARP